MTEEKLRSTNVKLYILLVLLVGMIVFFGYYFLRDYVKYYWDLYTFRTNLVRSLTDTTVAKPYYNSNDPVKGNPRATIVIFEYADFSCEACAAIQPALKEIESFYGANNVLFIFKDMPVTVAPEAKLAHEAAHCAQEQNAFFPYHDSLYANQGNFSKELFVAIAKELSLDESSFTSCLESGRYTSVVDNNLRDALRLGIDAAPTLFINNQEVISGFNFQNLRAIIENSK